MAPSSDPRHTLSRRAAWLWTGAVALLLVLVWLPVRSWYEVERYTRLREHDMRRNREAFEALRPMLEARTAPAVVVSEIIGLEPTDDAPADSRAFVRMETPERLFEALRARALASGYSVVVVDGAGRTDGGFPPHPEVETIADVPELTDYLHEGESSWVRLRVAQVLADRPSDAVFVWSRWTELMPPAVRHARIRNSTARMSELQTVWEFTSSIGRSFRDSEPRAVTLGRGMGDAVREVIPFSIASLRDTLDADEFARMLFRSE